MSGTTSLLTQIIPLAFGAAISPTALMGLILLLSISKKPRLSGIGYYIGSLILVLIVVAMGLILGAGITSSSSHPNPALSIIDLIIGIILVIMGIRRILRPQKLSKRSLQMGSNFSTYVVFLKGLSFGFGMFLINFSTIIIVLEAGKLISTSSADVYGKLLVTIILVLITLLVCEVPLIMCFMFPKNANVILRRVNIWMKKNGHILMGLVILAIGVYLLWIGSFKLGII